MRAPICSGEVILLLMVLAVPCGAAGSGPTINITDYQVIQRC